MIDRKPLLPVGEKGRFDCGMVSVRGAPAKFNGKLLVFYNGRATVHDGRARYPDKPLPEPCRGIGVAEFSPSLLNL